MIYGLILSVLIAMPCMGQTKATGEAKTSGPCSPAVTGSNNQLTINCQGISNKLGTQLSDLLNRILKTEPDTHSMVMKLDGCLAGVKQIVEQQAPRHLTDAQMAAIAQELKPYTGQVFEITPYWDMKEPMAMANRIADALINLSGWKLEQPKTYTALMPGIGGILVYVHPKAFERTKTAAAILVKTLNDQGISSQLKLQSESDTLSNKVVIDVGVKE